MILTNQCLVPPRRPLHAPLRVPRHVTHPHIILVIIIEKRDRTLDDTDDSKQHLIIIRCDMCPKVPHIFRLVSDD